MILCERYEVCIYVFEVDVLLITFQDFRYTPRNHDIVSVVYIHRSFFESLCSFGI